MTRLAKDLLASKLEKLSYSITPFLFGSVPTTLEKSYSIALKVYHLHILKGTNVRKKEIDFYFLGSVS
ncbi:hypothetical protein [Neobacillus massiliamazoniensis]|uniref:hypothetical protein n=1 Tax=Neobacillus massiliamazoniensis TaxID=1499688 RepID=UPI000AC5968F|nr:hypothetical protein [Neobacillus massiliamazoniensis]